MGVKSKLCLMPRQGGTLATTTKGIVKIMAQSNRATAETETTETTETAATYKQPIVYHGVTATGRGRGHFVRVPAMPVLDTIATTYGANVAAMWHGFMVRALTQVGGSRGGAKAVPQNAEAERAAIAAAFAEIAAGTYESSRDDVETSEADNKWNRTLLSVCKPKILEALIEAGQPTTDDFVEAAFKAYYDNLLATYGEEAAAQGFTPSKKGAAKAAGPQLGTLAL